MLTSPRRARTPLFLVDSFSLAVQCARVAIKDISVVDGINNECYFVCGQEMAAADEENTGNSAWNRTKLKLNLQLDNLPQSVSELQSIAQELQRQK